MEQASKTTEETHAPEGSYWPIVLAATLTLTTVGLISHLAITAVGGVLSLIAMIAWAAERFQGLQSADPASTRGIGSPDSNVDGLAIEVSLEAGRKPGWWGLVWFITTEALFFANLIVAYLFLRLGFHGSAAPPMAHLELLLPSINTVILLLSGVPAYFGLKAIERDDRNGLMIGFGLAALLGAIFLAGQGYEYMTAGFTAQSTILAAGFFVLTGFHGVHVIAGIGLLLFVAARSLQGHFSARNSFFVQVASTYWHFVDVVWIFLFIILYLAQ